MNDGQRNPISRNSAEDKPDALWQLLGEARPPEPDAWFTVRTLARCRHEGASRQFLGVSLVGIRRWALGGGLGLCLAVVSMGQFHSDTLPPAPEQQKNVQEAFAIVASIDDSDADAASSSTSTWQDSSL